ncbi:hypothetical protein [Fodinibius saliphilus]|uniref:hypothetical protein n=1 Tax=Fodinibius saliphilus TaxID=1920650 RepID=UPI00110943A7|nr:hypothetical protein [Fodinibius saliphilus]
MKLTKLLSFATLIALLIGFLTSCDTTNTNTELGDGNVELQFKTVSSNTSSKTVFPPNNTSSSHDSLLIEGSNGTLQIDDIRFIVAEFEMDPSEADDDSTELEEFESDPFFVDLPLGEETLSLANNQITAGLYEELEFEVEDLDFDEEEGEEEQHQALIDSIRSDFADWPNEASMMVVGTFTPTDGDSQSFTVFAEAEIEIEREFNPPLEVTEDNIQQVVSVRINPVRWFEQSDGSVLDLSQYDWDQHQQLLEFEAEFENGVEEIEVQDEDDDSDE